MSKSFNRIILKIGTNVLTKDDGSLDEEIIEHLSSQVSQLKKSGREIVLVSSGAVGAARTEVPLKPGLNHIVKRQVWSSIGQVRLMSVYQKYFASQNLHTAQVLATKEDFRDRQHFINMKSCLLALLRENIIPIINENDVISITELMFTDNDELSGLIAALLNADALIMLTSVDGIINLSTMEVIPTVASNDRKIHEHISSKKSSFGRGGMHTKIHVAQQSAKLGIDTYIANGRTKNVLLELLSGELVCTHFPAGDKKSGIKRWIAYAEGNEAIIHINRGAFEALASPRATSLLPVGIEQYIGEFQKGDLVRIQCEEQIVGVGLANYSSEVLRKTMKQANQKHLIHYDYLLLY